MPGMSTYNRVCHIEFDVTDLARAQAFYAALFGWTFRPFMDSMVIFGIGEEHIGGLMKVDEVHSGKSPSIWFQVENLESMQSAATANGGSANADISPVPGVGHSTIVHDPDGNPIGLVQYDAC